jgi:uncharacterized damage-inducible protein DinB
MAFNEELIAELEGEAKTTRRLLERIPADVWDYKPHEKSFSMGALNLLVAQMFGWIPNMIRYPELDFANAGAWASEAKTADEVVALLDKSLADAKEQLGGASDEVMNEMWTLRNGEDIYYQGKKREIIRQTISHMSHHRGQLTVYARLKDIPVPSIYGPTADETEFNM